MSEETKILQTALFGPIKVDISTAISFPEGLIGFPECRTFVLLDDEKIAPFQWFQSLDKPGLTFSVIEPARFLEGFRLEFWQEKLDITGADDIENVMVLLIVVLSNNLDEITVNLKGPILINPETRIAVQIVNDVPEYSTRHKLEYGKNAGADVPGPARKDAAADGPEETVKALSEE